MTKATTRSETTADRREHSYRIRWGAWVLGLSAVLFAAFPLIHPFPARADADLVAWAEGVTSVRWVLGHMINIVSLVTLIFGLLAIYAVLSRSTAERAAFTGLMFGLAGIGLVLPTGGVETFAQPAIGRVYQQHGGEVYRVSEQLYTAGLGGPTIMLGLLLLDIGVIALVVAIWRSGRLPRLAALIFALGIVLFFPAAPPIVRMIGGVLTGIGGVWLALAMLTQVRADGRTERVTAA